MKFIKKTSNNIKEQNSQETQKVLHFPERVQLFWEASTLKESRKLINPVNGTLCSQPSTQSPAEPATRISTLPEAVDARAPSSIDSRHLKSFVAIWQSKFAMQKSKKHQCSPCPRVPEDNSRAVSQHRLSQEIVLSTWNRHAAILTVRQPGLAASDRGGRDTRPLTNGGPAGSCRCVSRCGPGLDQGVCLPRPLCCQEVDATNMQVFARYYKS